MLNLVNVQDRNLATPLHKAATGHKQLVQEMRISDENPREGWVKPKLKLCEPGARAPWGRGWTDTQQDVLFWLGLK